MLHYILSIFRFKIPNVQLPNLAKLAECMQGIKDSVTAIQSTSSSFTPPVSLQKSVAASFVRRTHSLDQASIHSVKAPSGTLLAAYTPNSLRNKYKKTYHSKSHIEKRVSAPGTVKSAATPAPEAEASTSSLSPLPGDPKADTEKATGKFVASNFKNLLSLKEKLKKTRPFSPIGSTPSVEDSESSMDSQRATGQTKAASKKAVTDEDEKDMIEETEPAKTAVTAEEDDLFTFTEDDNSMSVDQPVEEKMEDKEEQSSSESSDSDIPIPKLRLRTRKAASSSESDTEGSPVVANRRRGRSSKLVVESEESDVEVKCRKTTRKLQRSIRPGCEFY